MPIHLVGNICNASSCLSHAQSDSHHTVCKQPSWGTCEAVTSRTECQHHGGQKMSEQRQKGKTLENGCHGRRLGLCAVYLSLLLTAMFLSVLTPCQPHLAGALWVAGRRLRCRHTKQAGWMGLTGMGSNGASLPDADNSGARGRGLKPEAPAWYFKRPEWLWSQLSINRCTQSGKNKTWNGRGKKLRRWQRTENIDRCSPFFFFFSFYAMRQSADSPLGLFTHATKPQRQTLYSALCCCLHTVVFIV